MRECFSDWLTSIKQSAAKMAPEQSRRVNRVEGMIDPLPIIFSHDNPNVYGNARTEYGTNDKPKVKTDLGDVQGEIDY